ncbi:nucleotidyltransferase family protein [Clostridium cylindrosporum]|uniref:Molybdenum cofactor cytidylyltransferase n=1 Tax=Clostridium cylindrosporum DSM 605 TaxID=1121307 RepID=A0A0J8D985_CLOCY|nr:nucleotidyltransferase family protein [Clostridium cylindrosporum]KMT20899.1 molybdenum cofactor cytidylyltransferase [Clostridium cylindrosporum DSM 605]
MEVEGIVLAAGLSTRTGDNYKMSLDIDGKSIIERCIEGMYDVCSKIIVVGGHRIEEIHSILSRYNKVKVVYNENYRDGMFSSVKEGVRHITKERFFFTPGDYPIINKNTYNAILKIDSDIVIPRFNERKGHPILIKSYLIEDLLNNCNYTSLRDFVRSKYAIIIDVNDSGVLKDVDTMEDYDSVMKIVLDNKENMIKKLQITI